MTFWNNLTVACTALAVLAAPLTMASAETLKKHGARYAQSAPGCPVHRNQFGELVDCQGWRNYNGFWDSSCFHLPYLPAQFACSGRGGRR